MHKIDYWYLFYKTVDHKTIVANWIDSQIFEDGSAIILIRDGEEGIVLRAIQVKEIIMIDTNRFSDASLAQ